MRSIILHLFILLLQRLLFGGRLLTWLSQLVRLAHVNRVLEDYLNVELVQSVLLLLPVNDLLKLLLLKSLDLHVFERIVPLAYRLFDAIGN